MTCTKTVFLFTFFLTASMLAAEHQMERDNSIADESAHHSRGAALRQLYSRSSCNEKQHEEWHFKKFSPECRDMFSNATSLNQIFQMYCNPLCKDMYLDYIDSCGSSEPLVSLFFHSLCEENEKGVPCYRYLMSDDYYNPKPEVDQECNTLKDTCQQSCSYMLDSLSQELGCCVNTLYNITSPSSAVAYQLWDECNVAKPKFCGDAKETLAGATATNLASNLNVLSIAIIVLLMAVMK